MTNISAVVLRVNSDVDGAVFDEPTLRACANGKTLFYDETEHALVYKGPAPKQAPLSELTASQRDLAISGYWHRRPQEP